MSNFYKSKYTAAQLEQMLDDAYDVIPQSAATAVAAKNDAVTAKSAAEAAAASVTESAQLINTLETTTADHAQQINQLNAQVASGKTPITVTNVLYGVEWEFAATTHDVISGEAIFTASERFQNAYKILPIKSVIGHTYYFRCKVKASSSLVAASVTTSSGSAFLSERKFHSGSGNYEILEGVYTANIEATPRFGVIDYGTLNFAEIRCTEAMITDITNECGVGNEPTISAYKSSIYAYNSGSYFVSNALTVQVDKYPSYKPLLFIDIANEVINVISKYNGTHDMRYVLNKKGPNTIFDFAYAYKILNSSLMVSSDKTAGTVFWTNTTDSFGPYVVTAVNNIDGDIPSASGFTGGNHGYNGDSTGSATGRTATIKTFVDGRAVTTYSGYASSLDVEWVNYVQAANTKKAIGTGREVVKETYRLHYDGYEWSVSNKIELLEECSISVYYGLQLSVTPWGDYTLFQSGLNKQWYSGNINCNSGDKNCDIITHKKSSDFADAELVLTSGLGRGDLSTAKAYNAFRANYNKSYFNLIDTSTTLVAGTILTWRGKYRFYSA